MLRHTRDLLTGGWRFASGLRGYLSETLEPLQAKAILERQLFEREKSFLFMLERAVYANEDSPYRRLLLHAGYHFEDVRSRIVERGVEATLSELYDSGVYVTLDEFKGRTPIRRPGLELTVSQDDFDNPLLTAHYQARTGGSRGSGTRVPFDFNFLAYEAAGHLWDLHANGIVGRPIVLCQAAPPSAQGLSNLLRVARAGHMPVKWFSTTSPPMNRQGLQARSLMAYALIASRLAGRPIPSPKFLNDGMQPVVDYLVQLKQKGPPPIVYSVPGQAVRICLAAERSNSDISGTTFYGGGEPYTPGKDEVLKRVGALGVPHYGMSEIGRVALHCGVPTVPDDMHLQLAKLAVLQRPVQLRAGPTLSSLFITTLLTSSPKLMLNVDSGDYAEIEERDCGCIWQSLGFTTHIHTVHSYDKLTSEGVMFTGSMLYQLVEEVLPARFGGNPTDYQFIEEEEGGLPRVSLIVAPEIGPLDEELIVNATIEHLGFAYWSRRMAEEWRRAGTLRVKRQEPSQTAAAKILPLHVFRSDAKQERFVHHSDPDTIA